MRKIFLAISMSPLIMILIFSFKLGKSSAFPALLTGSVLLTLFLNYLYFEKSNTGTKEIAIIATLSAFAGISRVPFYMIPSVQPTTFIIAISGLVFGSYEGFLIGATSAFISNIFLGQGPWTPWQMIAWGSVGFFSGLIGTKFKKPKIEVFALICLFYGFLFGFIVNIWGVIGFVKDINKTTILISYMRAFPFDVIHGVGNFFFVMIFYDKFFKILNRFKLRIT